MLRVTADSNIYISSLHFGGLPKRLLDLAREGHFHLNISPAIYTEVSRVLRLKFGWRAQQVELAISEINQFVELITPTRTIAAVAQDPSDDRILECATAAGSDYVISGDKHLLRLGSYSGIKIIRPSEMVAVLGR